jgi:N-acetylneuraminate lyase
VTTLAQLEELCAITNVAGVKFTDFDLFKLSQITRPERCVFNGRDEVLAAGLLMGADGGIGSFYNLVPERFVEIQALARAGRWDEARARQTDVNALIAAVLRFPLFPAIKQILNWTGLACGTCVLPRGPLTEAEQVALRRAVVDAGFPQLG